MVKAMRILVSVNNKEGIVDFLKRISGSSPEIFASDGTAAFLASNGIKCRPVSDLTGSGSILGGRVKTLHPAIYAGLLSTRDEKSDSELKRFGYGNFDMVVSNLYPFGEVAESGALNSMVENIDIGGVSLTRAAAKNWTFVTILTSPEDYQKVADEIVANGSVTPETRKELALKAFAVTAAYDALIYTSLYRKLYSTEPDHLFMNYSDRIRLRYGENPDQKGYMYRQPGRVGIPNAKQLHGKELSYNNILDASTALETLQEFEEATAVILKHNTPCGVSSAESIEKAFIVAYNADSESAYGSIVALNREVDEGTAREVAGHFVEVILAPSFSEESLVVLKKRKNLRVLEVNLERDNSLRYRSIPGGMLVQSPMITAIERLEKTGDFEATDRQLKDMVFAWKVAAHCRSNAIVLASDLTTLGIGAGQTSRIESLRIAVGRAGRKVNESVMASDGFLPFSDSVKLAAESGISAIIQPGGSIRDEEVIAECNRLSIPMYFTGRRVFLH